MRAYLELIEGAAARYGRGLGAPLRAVLRRPAAAMATVVVVVVFVAVLGASSLFGGAGAERAKAKTGQGVVADRAVGAYAELPLAFERNRGQSDPRVRFLARGAGYTLFLTPREAVLSLTKDRPPARAASPRRPGTQAPAKATTAAVRLQMVGANRHPRLAAADRLPGQSNYMIGSDPKRWRSGVPRFAKVRYEQVYPGIDVVYYGDQGKLEYDFLLRAGADPDAIGVRFGGAKRVKLDNRGDLLLKTAAGTVRQAKPVAYQRLPGGARRAVQSRYVLEGARRVGLALGAYDPTKPLVIDPILDYSTYLGGTREDEGNAIAVDGSGSAYLTGRTGSPDFPTKNAYAPTIKPGGDVFVAKFNPAGSGLEYATYLGGTIDSRGRPGFDTGRGIAVDASGSAYVTGFTVSADFPTKNAFDSTGPVPLATSAFVAKLSPSGSALDYSTYLGGDVGVLAGTTNPTSNIGDDIAVDASGRAYVTGATTALDFPTKNAYDPVLGGQIDAFVAKLDPSQSGASSLVYSTFLGGTGFNDIGKGIAVDASGSAYVTGDTQSADFPTKNAYQPLNASRGGSNVFVTKFKPAGNELDYSTYLGGTGGEQGGDVAVEPSGAAYVTGSTGSSEPDPPERGYPTTPGAFQRQHAGYIDAFVTKLTPSGSALGYSTFLGGSGPPDASVAGIDRGEGIALDSCRNAYVTGHTFSSNFPVKDPVQSAHSAGVEAPQEPDAFVTKLNPTGSALEYSTYLGGKRNELLTSIAANPVSGIAYVAGTTYSTDFPTRNAFQPTSAPSSGGGLAVNAFVASLSAPFAPCAAPSPSAAPAISINDVAVGEGDSGDVNATFTVSLSVSPTKPVSVRYATADDSATAPGDYASASGTVSFGPGETNKAVAVAVNGDRLDERDERFFVNLSSPQNATIADGQGIATIRDDDGGPGGGPGGLGGSGGGGVLGGCGSGTNVIAGTPGHDRRRGTDAADRIFAGAGNDVIDGLAGDDCIDLGSGRDRGQGNRGADLVVGGVGADLVAGAAGSDRLDGGAGNDRVAGGPGNDRALGGTGRDRIDGGFGNDRLDGGGSGDVLRGNAGNDRIVGRSGNDRISGAGGRDRISAGPGRDRIWGRAGNDRIVGRSGDDRISGAGGRDRISAGPGRDRIWGRTGNDRIAAGAGRDRISAGAGADHIRARDGRRDRINCGRGSDTVIADRFDRIARNCERVTRASGSGA